MPRKPRPLVDGGIYHCIARGNNRQAVFPAPAAFQAFLEGIARAKTRYPAQLYHYCLMTNHVHLLLRVIQGAALPRFMQGLLQGYGRVFKQLYPGYVGHVWQGRYKSPLIAEESYFLEAGRYIERNPVRAGLVTDPADYPYSSCRYYTHGQPNPLIDPDPYYAALGSTRTQRQAAYRHFVQVVPPHETLVDEHFFATAF